MNEKMPTQVEPSSSGRALQLRWSTGEAFELPYFDLRFECPCANCVDENTGKRTLRREQVKQDVRPTQVAPVGRYALQIQWSDGHRTGMYHFDTLYKLCERYGTKA